MLTATHSCTAVSSRAEAREKEVGGPIKFEAAGDPVPVYTLWKKIFFFTVPEVYDSSVVLSIGTVPTKLPVLIAVLDSIKVLGCTRVNQKVKAIFKLRGNWDREELTHCAVLTMPVEEFSHVQYSALPSVERQHRGREEGCSFARLYHRRTTWCSAVSLGRRSETCGNSPSYVGSVWTEHCESTKG